MSAPDEQLPTRVEHRMRAIADLVGASNGATQMARGDLSVIVQAINGLTSAMLALSADDAAPVPAAPVAPAAPAESEPDEVIDYDGAGPARWLCSGTGCAARRHSEPWQAHMHQVVPCRNLACPHVGGRGHAHLTRSNITRYVGGLCTADNCPDGKYEHGHWFEPDRPDAPLEPRWLARA